jgi:hypothetical protein
MLGDSIMDHVIGGEALGVRQLAAALKIHYAAKAAARRLSQNSGV